MRTLFLLVLGWSGGIAYAAPIDDSVSRLVKEGVDFVEAQKYAQAVGRFETALSMDKRSLLARYELAYTYYKMSRYRSTHRHLRKARRVSEASPLVYQLEGNTWDKRGRPAKAVATYHKGLEHFPNAGELHLELGVMEAHQTNWAAALYWWEKGIEADSDYGENYYWASREMGRRGQWFWAFLYGEIFCNIEMTTERTLTTAGHLWNLTENIIEFEPTSSGQSQPRIKMFRGDSETASLQVAEVQMGHFSKDSFEDVIEVILEVAATLRLEESPDWPVRQFAIDDHYRVRALTASLWSQSGELPGASSHHGANSLFERWSELEAAGLLEAYTAWLLGGSLVTESKQWALDHSRDVIRLYTYFDTHPFQVRLSHSRSADSEGASDASH